MRITPGGSLAPLSLPKAKNPEFAGGVPKGQPFPLARPSKTKGLRESLNGEDAKDPRV